MDKLNFRDLRADEIDCRIAQVKENGISLLLYKDARCDMNILDETVGAYNWQRSHSRDNANCTVSIWDKDKAQWISKEDTGTESFTEREKGLASDSFKRACVSVGIGRELYSAPFVWVSTQKCSIQKKGDKLICYDKFLVSDISYNKDREIIALSVLNCNTGEVVYSMFPKQVSQKNSNLNELHTELNRTGVMIDTVLARYGVQSIDEMTPELLTKAINSLKRTKTKSA